MIAIATTASEKKMVRSATAASTSAAVACASGEASPAALTSAAVEASPAAVTSASGGGLPAGAGPDAVVMIGPLSVRVGGGRLSAASCRGQALAPGGQAGRPAAAGPAADPAGRMP